MGHKIKVGTEFEIGDNVWTVEEITISVFFGYTTTISATNNNGSKYGWKLEDFSEMITDGTIKIKA